MNTLVLGIGNLLMGDEGVGLHVVRHLEAHHPGLGADVVDGGTGGFHLLGILQSYDRVCLVDATADGRPPGSISVVRPRFASDYPRTLTAHDIGLKDLMESLVLTGHAPEVILVTISVAEVEKVSLTLSPAVAAAIPSAAREVISCLSR